MWHACWHAGLCCLASSMHDSLQPYLHEMMYFVNTQLALPHRVSGRYLSLSHIRTGACTINRPLITMHERDLPTYCCAHGQLYGHAPVQVVSAPEEGMRMAGTMTTVQYRPPVDQSPHRRVPGYLTVIVHMF